MITPSEAREIMGHLLAWLVAGGVVVMFAWFRLDRWLDGKREGKR